MGEPQLIHKWVNLSPDNLELSVLCKTQFDVLKLACTHRGLKFLSNGSKIFSQMLLPLDNF
jgi:hypothetical protein